MSNFGDLTVDNMILLESSKQGKITASVDEVTDRIENKDIQTGKWKEYIDKWEAEGRI